jgi:hypothetical protein
MQEFSLLKRGKGKERNQERWFLNPPGKETSSFSNLDFVELEKPEGEVKIVERNGKTWLEAPKGNQDGVVWRWVGWKGEGSSLRKLLNTNPKWLVQVHPGQKGWLGQPAEGMDISGEMDRLGYDLTWARKANRDSA